MTDWNPKANEIFLRAAEIGSPDQRRAFLEAECGADGALREQVDSLIAASGRVGEFLNEPAISRPGVTVDFEQHATDRITEGPGTVIGPYKLLQQVGEGGFGVVYMAEQSVPVRRKVALKII